jgi:hypothetical protein
MSDNLALDGDLASISAQLGGVKARKTTGVKLFQRALRSYEVNIGNQQVWIDLLRSKERRDSSIEAFYTILNSIEDAIGRELARSVVEVPEADRADLQQRLVNMRTTRRCRRPSQTATISTTG